MHDLSDFALTATDQTVRMMRPLKKDDEGVNNSLIGRTVLALLLPALAVGLEILW
jgi:hypothetical protein